MNNFKKQLPNLLAVSCVVCYAGLYLYLDGAIDFKVEYLGYLALPISSFLNLIYLYDCKFGRMRIYNHKYHIAFPYNRLSLYKKEVYQLCKEWKYLVVVLSGLLFIILWIKPGIGQLFFLIVLYLLNTFFLVLILIALKDFTKKKGNSALSSFFYLNLYYSFVPVFTENLNLGFYSPFGAMYLAPIQYQSFILKSLPVIQLFILIGLIIFIRKRSLSWITSI